MFLDSGVVSHTHSLASPLSNRRYKHKQTSALDPSSVPPAWRPYLHQIEAVMHAQNQQNNLINNNNFTTITQPYHLNPSFLLSSPAVLQDNLGLVSPTSTASLHATAPTRVSAGHAVGGGGPAARFGWEGETKVVYIVVVGIAAMLATMVPQVLMSMWSVVGKGECECTC